MSRVLHPGLSVSASVSLSLHPIWPCVEKYVKIETKLQYRLSIIPGNQPSMNAKIHNRL